LSFGRTATNCHAGFEKIKVLEERAYMEGEKINGRKISSLVIKAVK